MGFLSPSMIVDSFGLTDGQAAADFGAGSGAHSLALARAVGSNGRVYAIDIQKELLARLSREAKSARAGNLEVVWSDLERAHGSKLADHSVDFVLIANFLFQVSGKYTLLLEAKRILRPTGRLAIIDWSDSFGGLGPPADHILLPTEARKIAAEAGFEPLNDFPAGDHHYGLLFKLKQK